jgi:iduronate 2-sulfatase
MGNPGNNSGAAPTTSRRSFLARAAVTALATTLPTLPSSAQSPSQADTQTRNKTAATHSRKRPLNVLFFMSDDMRPELACYNSRFNAHSPNIDALAAKGVRFDRNFCQFPLCNPSRSSLFTGHPPHTTKVLGNNTSVRNLHPDWITLPQLFRENGYTTLRSGKLFHAGLDDHKAWTVFDGDVESMHPTQAGRPMNIPHAHIPMPNGVLPELPADNQRSAHSDQIFILEGDGEGAGDYMVADLAIKFLDQCAKGLSRQALLRRLRLLQTPQPTHRATTLLRSLRPHSHSATTRLRCLAHSPCGLSQSSHPYAERRPLHRPRRIRVRVQGSDPCLPRLHLLG